MTSYPNKETYNKYKSTVKESKLSLSQYYTLIATYLELIVNTVIETRDGVEIPNFAHMIIISRPNTSNTKFTDVKKSLEYDMKINHNNMSSENRFCKIIFSNKSKKYKIKHKRFWTFKASKTVRSKISKEFNKNYNRYLRVYKMGHIAKRLMD